MKIEICENTFWLSLWTVIVIGLVVIVTVSVNTYTTRTLRAFEAGYRETTVQGTSQLVWTKP